MWLSICIYNIVHCEVVYVNCMFLWWVHYNISIYEHTTKNINFGPPGEWKIIFPPHCPCTCVAIFVYINIATNWCYLEAAIVVNYDVQIVSSITCCIARLDTSMAAYVSAISIHHLRISQMPYISEQVVEKSCFNNMATFLSYLDWVMFLPVFLVNGGYFIIYSIMG